MTKVTIRAAIPSDAETCGPITYEAFRRIAEQHGFPPDVPNVEAAIGLVASRIAHPAVFGVVALCDNQIVGSNYLDERDPIRGVGPITVAPHMQQRGVGRQLMEAVLERGRDSVGIRLVQDAFNVASMSLYASLGFHVREPLLLMVGKPKGGPLSEIEVLPMRSEDLEECAALCTKVHGFDRANELRDALANLAPLVAVRHGRIAAYATAPRFWPVNHGVAQSDEDMHGLLLGAGATNEQPLSFLVPTRRAGFYRWCLSQGLRAESPRTLMATGKYHEPKGCYLPSMTY
jgi:predicted N-acetyltransferase YhbS